MISLIFIAALFLIGYVPMRWAVTDPLRRLIDNKFVISVFVPPALALLFPRPWFYLLLVLVTFLMTTRDRVDAVCRYIMLMMLLPATTWIASGPGYLRDFTTADVLSVALIVKCMMKRDGSERPLKRFTTEDAFIGVIFLILWLGADRLPSFTSGVRGFADEAFLLVLPYIALRMSIRTSEEFMRVVACFVIATGLLSIMAIYEATNGWSLYSNFDRFDQRAGLSKALLRRGGTMRAVVSMRASLVLGFVLLLGVIGALFARPFVRRRWMQLALAVLIFMGMVMTQSRSNLGMLPVGLLIFCLLRRKWGAAAFVGIGGPAALATLYALAGVSPRIAAFLNVNAASAPGEVYDYRQLLLERGLQEAASHRWTGAQLSLVVDRMSDIQQGDHIVDLVNTYLTWYLVSGLLGMVPFFILFAMIWSKLLSVHLHRFRYPALVDTRAYAVLTLAAVAFQLGVMSFMDRVPICMVFALAAARIVSLERKRLVREQRRAAAKAEFDALPLAPNNVAGRKLGPRIHRPLRAAPSTG